ncbi:MAG TPA: hypothetical protein DCZ03_08140 [Gammaproteobacteria bacterium]|nr:hypothetical protein [Gammaproteobacteria bacterium]
MASVISSNIESLIQPKSLGKFRFVAVAEGGVCEVYRAEPLSGSGPSLAIKRIRDIWRHHKGVNHQFEIEAKIVQSLFYPTLPRYVSRGVLKGKAYYAYEFFHGMPLLKLWQQQGSTDPDKLLKMSIACGIEILEQLYYLHSRPNPIYHGDISAENIILDRDGHVHLVDFGCAHTQKEADEKSYQWLGKPSYISPEQAKGEPWDGRSDLYQVGVMLYEMITSKRWNRGRSPREKVLFAASKQTMAPNFLAELVGSSASQLVAGLLAPDANHRIQTAGEALALLKQG